MSVLVQEPVRVALPTVAIQSSRDWFDWLGLVGALLVAPIFALVAAWVGARVGGRESRQAAIEAHEREAAAVRRLRAEERGERERHERALLLRRFERDLMTAGGIADGLARTGQFVPVMPVSAMNLEAMWDAFTRRRDSVALLDDPDLEHEIEFFYEWALSRRGFLEEWLRTEESLLNVADPASNADEIRRRAAVAEDDLRTHVERARETLPRVRARIEQLAARSIP